MIDIVFPEDNEAEFISLAEKLGYSSLCFVYNKPTQISEFQKRTKIKLYSGIIARAEYVQKFRKKADLIIVRSSDKNRLAFERTKPDVIFELEDSKKSDFIHSRNSGLNQVLCKLAARNDVLVGFSLSFLLEANALLRTRIIGRMMQNTRFCRKFKVKMVLASFAQEPWEMRACHDLLSLGQVLGMSPGEAKLSLNNAEEKAKENQFKLGPKYIAKGIEKV